MSPGGLNGSGWCLSVPQGFFGMAKFYRRNKHFSHMNGRSYGRKRFYKILPTATCKTRDSAFIAPICDISSSGVFIKTTRQFSVGQEVAMTITFPSTGESRMVTGEVARVSPEGVGINFKVFFKD